MIKQVTPSGTVTTVAGVSGSADGHCARRITCENQRPERACAVASGTSVSLAVVDSAEDAILRVILRNQ